MFNNLYVFIVNVTLSQLHYVTVSNDAFKTAMLWETVIRNAIKIYRIYSERAKTYRNGLLGVIYLYFLNRTSYTFTTAQLANDK